MIINDQNSEVFLVQAKIAPNVWVSVGEISAQLIEYEQVYSSIEEANTAKRKIKNYLKVYEPHNKLPIRVFKG